MRGKELEVFLQAGNAVGKFSVCIKKDEKVFNRVKGEPTWNIATTIFLPDVVIHSQFV